MPPKKPKEEGNQQPLTAGPARSLQSFEDYVNLIQDTINGVFDKSVDTKTANTVGMLTGYGLQALKEARGGKLKMSVFLQNMSHVNVQALSSDEIDRFLQGSEDVQVEVLQILESRGGINSVDVEMIPKKEIKPKMDVKALSKMTGLEGDWLKQAFAGEGTKPELTHSGHEWIKAVAGDVRFCKMCGTEREILQSSDMTSPCSGEWGLS